MTCTVGAYNVLEHNRRTQLNPTVAGPGNGRRLASLACLLLVGSLLGLSLVVAKIAVVEGAAPLAFLSVSMIAAGTVLLVGEWWNGRVPRIDRRIAEYGLTTGVLFAAPNAVGFLAVEHVGAGFLSLTFAFPILFTYLLSLGLRLERLQAAKALGVASGLAGGLILALSKVNLGTSPTFWVVLAMSSPVTGSSPPQTSTAPCVGRVACRQCSWRLRCCCAVVFC